MLNGMAMSLSVRPIRSRVARMCVRSPVRCSSAIGVGRGVTNSMEPHGYMSFTSDWIGWVINLAVSMTSSWSW
jgi:hypothetical protein